MAIPNNHHPQFRPVIVSTLKDKRCLCRNYGFGQEPLQTNGRSTHAAGSRNLLPACDLTGGPVLECTIAVSAGLESLFTEGLTTTCEVKGDLVEVLLADCILEVDPAGDWAAASDPEYDLLTGLASASDVGGKGVVLGGSGTSAFMF